MASFGSVSSIDSVSSIGSVASADSVASAGSVASVEQAMGDDALSTNSPADGAGQPKGILKANPAGGAGADVAGEASEGSQLFLLGRSLAQNGNRAK